MANSARWSANRTEMCTNTRTIRVTVQAKHSALQIKLEIFDPISNLPRIITIVSIAIESKLNTPSTHHIQV